MALLIRGKTVCLLCGSTIGIDDLAVTVPSFIANRRDHLHRFNDRAFHKTCIEQDPDGLAVLERSAEVTRRLGPGNRRCVVCDRHIDDPDDYLTFGFLTDDDALAAHEFNYLHLHRSHVDAWPEAQRAWEALHALMASGAWEPISPLAHLAERLGRRGL
jgi:hypothetical protein